MTKDPRDLWTGAVARVYSVLPWQMGQLTADEWQSISDDAKEIGKAQS